MSPRVEQITALLQDFIHECQEIAMEIHQAQPEFVDWSIWVFYHLADPSEPADPPQPPLYLCMVSVEAGPPEVFRQLRFRFLPDRVITLTRPIDPRIPYIDYPVPEGFAPDDRASKPYKKMAIPTH